MNPSRPFILRPVATTLLMVGVILVGLVAYRQLPVSALPQVDYPTIQVQTFYPGASPDVMASSVTAPLERNFGEIPGLLQMTSTSSFGSSVITLQFNLDLNIDVAEQEVQAEINGASNLLPTGLPNPPIYSKVNPADAPILTLAISSPTLPLVKVEDLADTTLAQKISQLSGVGLVSISGGQRPAVRVQANPTALASYGLSLEGCALRANIDQAKGTFDGQHRRSPSANDQLLSSEGYNSIIVAFRNGAPVRLTDVATAIDSAENEKQAAWANKQAAVILNIQRQPGANIISVVDRVKKILPQLQAALPASVHVEILTDRTTTIRASVADVQYTLLLTIALVVMVIFLFLRSLRATVIPSIAVPLSIVGTFGVMYLLGYSLNNLSLMALTISTGFVVDDAIVMIENISRYLEHGDSPLQAALKGSEQIGFTIVSLTVSLIAVLIPLLFMGDIVGRLFREFAVTLASDSRFGGDFSPGAWGVASFTPRTEKSRFGSTAVRESSTMSSRFTAHAPKLSTFRTITLLAIRLVGTPSLHLRAQRFLPGAGHGVLLSVSEAPQNVSFTAGFARQRASPTSSCRIRPWKAFASFIG